MKVLNIRVLTWTVAVMVSCFGAFTQAVVESETQEDVTVIQGAACQALYGEYEDQINHNVDWLSNRDFQKSVWVSCPLTRQSISGLADPRVKVRVYRKNGTGALDCMFHVRAVTGASWTTLDSAPVGWSYIDMTSPNTAPGASYSVRCHLPPRARIQKVVLYE